MPINLIILFIVLGFTVIDLVTGLIKAVKNKEYTSGKMREGLFHKSAFVLIIGLAWAIEFASGYLDLGITLPLVPIAGTYVILTEIGSVIENLCAINPELMPDKLKKIFGSKIKGDANPNDEDENATNETEDDQK